MVKPIALVKRGVLDKNARRTLQRGGYLVVESDDPEALSIVCGEVVPLNAGIVFHAAMKTLAEGNSYSGFGAKLAALAAKASEPKATKP